MLRIGPQLLTKLAEVGRLGVPFKSALHSQPPKDVFQNVSKLKYFHPLHVDDVFKAHNLTPSLATEADLHEASKLYINFLKENQAYTLENARIGLQNLNDTELKHYLKPYVEENTNIDELATFFRSTLKDSEQFLAVMGQAALHLGPEDMIPILKNRFISNPKADLILLKNPKGEIVGIEGINQFQKTHDTMIDQGNMEGIDPKHGLLSSLYVTPDYRNKGIGTALKSTIIKHSKQNLGYHYVWSPTEMENASHRANLKLGYQPLTAQTRFQESPVFTTRLNKKLMEEYNIGSRQLHWLSTAKI